MSFLELPRASTATGRVKEILDDTTRRWGFEANIVRALALRPEILEAEDHWSKAVMHTGLLPRRLKELLATAVSRVNETEYCVASHAYQARLVGVAEPQVAACRALLFDDFPPAERAALEFARKAARDMHAITRADIDELGRFYGAEEIVELVAVIASFMMYNTFVTLLGLEVESAHGRAHD
ncbi:MAG: carboxymuconolactone decarboxylase family protein [Thermoplasmatota archaeon]